MEKLITIILVLSMLTLASCGKKEEILEETPQAESSVSEASIPEVKEPEEEEVEQSPIDFNFMIENEVNAEELINHTNKLGLLKETWQEPSELNIQNLLTAFVKENNISENISEAEFEKFITTFIDIAEDSLHESEFYNAETKEYVNGPLETSDEEEERIIEVGEVSVVSENTYEINLIDVTDENNPIDFGTLTVENNENIPNYLSFVKPVIIPETPAPVSVAPVVPTTPETPANNNSDNTTSNGGTGGTTGGGTTSSSGSGSMWDGVDLPGDPNKATDTMVHVEWK